MARRTHFLFFHATLVIVTQLASLLFSPVCSAPPGALITSIPGFNGTIPSKHFAGYVTVDETYGKKLYYYFVESEKDPSKDPVVLWLNGGPGCSSFDAFVFEHGFFKISSTNDDKGPFNFEAGKPLPTLHLNPYSWTKVSSIIYLDSPSGVGYSYSGNASDYITGDLKTASDTHTFLLKWFELYKEYQSNPFFISGESYAGIYVPTLAYEVVNGIDAGVKPILNFKGYMVGNGVTDDLIDGNALVPFAHGMGLISDEIFEATNNECKGNFYNPTSSNCENMLEKVNELVEELNVYNILEPCYHGTSESKIQLAGLHLPPSFRMLGETKRPLPVRKRMFGRAWPFRAPVREGYVPTWPELLNDESVPCTNDEVATTWLNDEGVRKAIHAASGKEAGSWVLCTSRIQFYHDAGSMIKYHRNLTLRGYRAIIFSGDHDMCVPYTGSQAWTRSMGYKTVDAWRPWKTNNQIAGYLQEYENNLLFLTVKGSGHTVPEYKPVEALAFYSRWLQGRRI